MEPKDIKSGELDDLVHDMASLTASEVNNQGVGHQLQYLYRTMTWKQVKEWVERYRR